MNRDLKNLNTIQSLLNCGFVSTGAMIEFACCKIKLVQVNSAL